MWLLVVCLAAWTCAQRPEVSLPRGRVRGYTLQSREGRQFSAFTGIPYARPPVGPLRFKNAVPALPWEGIYEANQELPLCTQINFYNPFLINKTVGVEDCLYLNVFTPNLSGSLPVMVYINGGGFRSVTPGPGLPASRSKYLMDYGVVLVMFNYRVGALGFLSTEDTVLPGNIGMKDQVAALRWVKENIARFGGNPSQVTIFGESAGGASVHLHNVSPLSKDLFVRGIAQSGVYQDPWVIATPGSMRETTKRLASSLGCPRDPSQALLSCLMTKSNIEIANGERQFNILDFNPPVVYPVVIENRNVEHAFLNRSPFELEVTKPWMTGATTHEGAFKIIYYVAEPNVLKKYLDNIDFLLPKTLMYEYSSPNVTKVTRAVKQKYLNTKNIMDGISEMVTDGYFIWGMDDAIAKSKAPVYKYLFDYRGKTSITDIVFQNSGIKVPNLGVCHLDDLLYLFNFVDEHPNTMTPEDVKVSKRLLKRWTNFAKFGKPQLEGGIDWKPTGRARETLRISSSESIITNYKQDIVKFWHSLPLRNKALYRNP